MLAAPPSTKCEGDLMCGIGETDRPVVTVKDGILQGFVMKTVNGREIAAFRNIPYAQPPVGPLRFMAPVKNKPWTGIRDASSQSPQCIQVDLEKNWEVHGEEDCLYLNVYVPLSYLQSRSKYPLPVMVWISNGGFFYGAGSTYGPRYLLDHPVILVAFDFRVGPFGFFSTEDAISPGNQGLKDQVLALRWVQENIAVFGGNPKSVTLFGEDSGGGCAGLHILSPLSKGLVHRVIAQSGGAISFWTNFSNASATAQQVGELFDCPTYSTKDMVQCLRNVPAKELAPIQLKMAKWFKHPVLIFLPTVEPDLPGAFITKPPAQYYIDGEAAKVPMMAGFTTNEMTYVTSAMMNDTVHINDINREWDRVIPFFLDLYYNTTEVNTANARAIRKFYMGDRDFTWDTRLQFSKTYSYRYIVDGGLASMRYHSMFTRKPVYAYRFSYQGKYSSVQKFGQKPQDWGVSHLDELIYLMNNTDYYGTLERDNPADLQMSSLLTRIWVNFATYGNPNILGSTLRNQREYELWHPIPPATNIFSPLQFLDINLTPKMIPDPYVNEYLFWRRKIKPYPE